ncbi:MAG: SUMF1/EgtB/PvdO family nonheme iron enzyme [Bacteroidales bacterium]|nr:SUMF1/EgtB/PvdO family nonheme iron enzyme [Bacteroidales bacterium]
MLTFTTRSETLSTTTFTVNGVSFKMVYVPGGVFAMGGTVEQEADAYPNELPAHSVALSDFCIGETEVTQELWQAVMGSNPSRFSGSSLPVESVSWDDAQTFIAQLNALTGQNFSLPTEAEWEYAARGGNQSQGYRYSGSNTIGNVAWFAGNSSSQTHAVKTKAPNELGLYDMSGNVWEWCQDGYGTYSSDAQTNPIVYPGSYRVCRGGAWSYDDRSCRVSRRNNFAPTSSNYYIGLRLVIR